jgi:hypothetical protein
MRKQMPGVMGAAALLSLAAASSAFALAGTRTVAQTYPVAATLCARAHTATLPPRLASQPAAVISACDTLVNAFAPLESTVDAARAAFLNSVSQEKVLRAAVCRRPVSDHAACTAARNRASAAIATAATTREAAVSAYHQSIEANRTAFWTTIQGLRTPASGS